MARPNLAEPTPSLVERLRLPLAALGVFGLLAGLAVWFVQGDFTVPARILMAAGVLLIGIYVALDPEDAWSRLSGRTALYSGNALLIALAAIAILVLFNVLGSRYGTKWDLTANAQFTLSDQSIQVAQTLPEPVSVQAFLQSSDSRRTDLEGLLSDYAAHSNGKLTYEFIDPDQRPSAAIAAGVTQYGTIVYQAGDKKQDSTGTTERDITTALIKLTRASKKLYFTAGHGERSIDGFEQENYGQIKQALERDNFTVESLNLATARAVPSDAAAVVVAGATSPFLDDEKNALKAYLDNGGKLMVLADPGEQANVNPLIERWQTQFTGNVVIDPAQALSGDPRLPVVDAYGQHTTTQDLRQATFYPFATDLTVPAAPPEGLTLTPIARSSDRSWGETNPQQIQQDDSDPKGPLTLALAVEQPVASDPSGGTTTRAYLIGSVNFVSNTALALNVPAGNRDLFLNAANWLAEQEDLVSIRPKDTTSRTMLLTTTQLNLMFLSTVLLLPLAVLAAGAGVWWTRR